MILYKYSPSRRRISPGVLLGLSIFLIVIVQFVFAFREMMKKMGKEFVLLEISCAISIHNIILKEPKNDKSKWESSTTSEFHHDLFSDVQFATYRFTSDDAKSQY